MLIKDPPIQVTDELWMLGSNEYPLYLFKGHTIFEGGVGSMGPLLAEQIQTLGLDPSGVKQVIIPHGHPDHVMAVPALREMFPQATVVASAIAAKTLSIDKAIGFFCKVDAALTESLTRNGTITEEHHPKPLEEMKIDVDEIVGEGDTIDVDGAVFQVLSTPGHSDCSLSFFEPEAKILFISDATGYYMHEHDCWWVNYFSDYQAYLDSIRRLAELDAEILCLGHLAVVQGGDDVKQYFADAIAATEQCHQRIVKELKEGKDGRQIAADLGSEIFEKTQLMPLDFLQKNCSLLVKLSMKHEGIEA
ncbi:MAG TPA: MBL fold metallo-hydrolase [Thermoguttaceae bacterium]|nr:MBL fold metallo-hydrolase [Thermoguttaceae bacterium]